MSEDRGRGLFTDSWREHLRSMPNDGGWSGAERQARQRIRPALRDSIRDFELLSEVPDTDVDDVRDDYDAAELNGALAEVLAFMYRMFDGDTGRLEGVIRFGVLSGARRLHGDEPGPFAAGAPEDANVSIDLEFRPSIEDARQKLDSGNYSQMTPGEVHLLILRGELDAEDLEQLREQKAGQQGSS